MVQVDGVDVCLQSCLVSTQQIVVSASYQSVAVAVLHLLSIVGSAVGAYLLPIYSQKASPANINAMSHELLYRSQVGAVKLKGCC